MATSKVLKPRRGSTTEHATFKGQAFEITFDTDKKTIVAHDGLTMGGFPLAHEAAITETDEALRALIEEKVSEVEGVSSSELRALETALRGLINNNAQQQAAKDADQDNVVTALDSALRALIAKYLPLAGGTMSGPIIMSENLLARRTVDNEVVVIRGGSDGTSASIQISGKNHSLPGWIALAAKDGENTNNLTVQPNGKGTLNGHDILTSAGGTLTGSLEGTGAKFNGNVSVRSLLRGDEAGTLLIGVGSNYDTSPSVVLYGRQRGDALAGLAILNATKESGGTAGLAMHPDGHAGIPSGRLMCTTTDFVYIAADPGNPISIPSGGTWRYFYVQSTSRLGACLGVNYGQIAGGSSLNANENYRFGIAWRIA